LSTEPSRYVGGCTSAGRLPWVRWKSETQSFCAWSSYATTIGAAGSAARTCATSERMSGSEVPPSAVPKSAMVNGVDPLVPCARRDASARSTATSAIALHRSMTSKQPLVRLVYAPVPASPKGTCFPPCSGARAVERARLCSAPAAADGSVLTRPDCSTRRQAAIPVRVGQMRADREATHTIEHNLKLMGYVCQLRRSSSSAGCTTALAAESTFEFVLRCFTAPCLSQTVSSYRQSLMRRFHGRDVRRFGFGAFRFREIACLDTDTTVRRGVAARFGPR